MEHDAIATTTIKTPDDVMGEIVAKFVWLFFAASTISIIVLIETLLLNRGCSL